MSAFKGKFRVATISHTPISPDVDGHAYGRGVRLTLVPSETPAENAAYAEEGVRGELHIGVLSEKAGKPFEVGQVYNLTLTDA